MADLANYISVALAADVQTDVTNGGLPAGDAGTYTLNMCNDNNEDVAVEAIYLTTGEAPTDAHKIHPSFTFTAKDFFIIQPQLLGEGWKIFIQASAPISVQLVGRKEG